MTARFTSKVGLVTGGGSGIGRATALAFAREGATVVVAGRNQDSLAETVKLIEVDGGMASAVVTDVTRSEDVANLVQCTVARHGGLNIAFNNAGVSGVGLVVDLDEDGWSRLIDTNLTGTWLSLKHEIGYMREHGGGVIVNMASNIGPHMRMPIIGAYGAAKAGIVALTRAAAKQHITEGVRINSISPGPVATDLSRSPGQSDAERDAMYSSMIPRGKIGAPEEIASAVLWLASDESSFVIGEDLVIDGGVTA